MAKDRLKELLKDGRTDMWKFSYSENGWLKAETFLDIVPDLGKYIMEHNISTPVLWFIDGASCHTVTLIQGHNMVWTPVHWRRPPLY